MLSRLGRFLLCVGFLLTPSPDFAQSNENPYLLRLLHENLNGTSCVLLQTSGAFHYENGDRDNTRVYEGEVPESQLRDVTKNLRALSDLSQRDIQEPLIVERHDLLQIEIYRTADVKLLRFDSAESQEPYRRSLRPLVQWMDGLRKLPHREFSEDAGKKNCLPPKQLALRIRTEAAAEEPNLSKPGNGNLATNMSAAGGGSPAQGLPLMRFSMLVRDSSGARQQCALVVNNGDYRFEQTSQKNGSKKLQIQIARGQIEPNQLADLRTLLNATALAEMHHRKPPGGMALNIMGAVIELSIARNSGMQELILTDSTHRSTFFYAGDGDISEAEPLLQFVRARMETNATTANASERNECTEVR